MLPAVDPDKRIISPASRRDDREARYTLTVIFRHESSSSSSSSGYGGDMDLTGGGVDGEHRSKDAKHVQEFRIRRAEPIIEWGEKYINLALALQVNLPSRQPVDTYSIYTLTYTRLQIYPHTLPTSPPSPPFPLQNDQSNPGTGTVASPSPSLSALRSTNNKDNNNNNINNVGGGGVGGQDNSPTTRGIAIKIGEKMTSAYLCAVFATNAVDKPFLHGNKGLDNSMIKYRLVKKMANQR